MSYDLTQQFTDSVGEVHEDAFEGREAASFGEFARAFFLGLGAVLFVSAGTFLIFSGIAATLLALVP